MTEPFRIEIPAAYLSLNRLLRMHWARRRESQHAWGFALRFHGRHVTPAKGKRRVVIERHGRGRMLDKDGAYGGAKPILDELVKLGLLLDDDAENLDLEVAQVKLKKGERPHTVITISDLAGSILAKSSAK